MSDSDSARKTEEVKPKLNLKSAQTPQVQEEDQRKSTERNTIPHGNPGQKATSRLVEKEVLLSPRTAKTAR
jgi:hypothetical protein